MKLIVLAAGYATRLYPLTLDRPKHLLDVAGRPVLEHVLAQLDPIGIDETYLVTNARFAGAFREWAARYQVKQSEHRRRDQQQERQGRRRAPDHRMAHSCTFQNGPVLVGLPVNPCSADGTASSLVIE